MTGLDSNYLPTRAAGLEIVRQNLSGASGHVDTVPPCDVDLELRWRPIVNVQDGLPTVLLNDSSKVLPPAVTKQTLTTTGL